jgi:hypothetical protein
MGCVGPGNELGNEGARSVAAVLARTQLRTLELCGTFDATTMMTSDLLTFVRSCCAADINIGSEGVRSLVDVLPITQLIRLDLSLRM